MDPDLTLKGAAPETAESLLDAIRDHPEWTERQRDEPFDRLIAGFPPKDLISLVRGRLYDLRGYHGEAVLRLIEILGAPELLDELAEALVAQPDLPPERTWEALNLLEGSGLIDERPELADRREELAEAIDEDGSLEGLIEQIEDDPDGLWIALHGLSAVEPEIRAEILAGLGRQPMGPGLIDFLRLLCFAHDPTTRTAAIDALATPSGDDPRLVDAWSKIAADHPDPSVAARARRQLDLQGGEAPNASRSLVIRQAPRLVASLVTGLDGLGRGYVVLSAEDRGRWTTAAFHCDVLHGVREVIGQVGHHVESVEGLVAEFAARADRDVVEGVPDLALGLLSGSLLLCGPRTTPALRYWLERTVGTGLRSRPFPGLSADWDPASLPFDEMPARTQSVLASCRNWGDDSDLTYELAEEILLREEGRPPNPRRDAGAYRYLFEHRLLGHLELYRRMLFWMAWLWHASGDLDLGRSALALAWQLSDPQHAVPGHPFIVALTTQSLATAQENLRQRIDPRDPQVRARFAHGAWP